MLLRDVASVGLLTALLAFLPLLPEPGTRAEALAWRGLSGVTAVGWVGLFVRVVPGLARATPLSSGLAWVGPLATLVGLVLFAWNVVAPGELSAKRYVGGLLCLLAVSASNFLLAVFGSERD